MLQQQVALNFEYLKPAQYLIDAIVHDPQYIKRRERSKSQRRIWENVPYDAYEKEKMADFMKIVAKNKIQLPADWQDSDTLKMVYCGKFKDKNYLKVLQSHLVWRAVPNNFQPTDINIAFLQKGIVYTFGRDKQQRPIIIMNLELVNLKQFNEEVYINALSYYFGIIKKNCFVPGKIENWDFPNFHLKQQTQFCLIFYFNLNILKLINCRIQNNRMIDLYQKLIAIQIATKTMQVNFCGCLDKLYLLNPSSSLSFSWKMVSAVADADTMEKVQMLKPNEYTKIQERIPANQLEEQYGGKVANLTKFWPPINIEIPGGYTEEILKAVESMKTAEIVIQKEVPASEEDELKLQEQMAKIQIKKEDDDDD